jgi:SLOG in TRPM, prokaryote
MITRQIPLEHGVPVRAANVSSTTEIKRALDQLNIPHPNSVIVLVGGAAGVSWLDMFPMRKAIGIIARLAEETQSVVIDGGTQAGIMTEIGKQRKQHGFSLPLIGVVFDNLIVYEEPATILDPNHTHFFLIPGKDWGDESAWISKIATSIAGNHKSITVLVNGGNISRQDIKYSLLENRPTFVIRGTGRLADEITLTGNVFPINIAQKPEAIFEYLKSRLC